MHGRLNVSHLVPLGSHLEYPCYSGAWYRSRRKSTALLNSVCLDRQTIDISPLESQSASFLKYVHTGIVEAQAGMASPHADTPSSLGNVKNTETGPSFTASSPVYRATVLP